MSNLLKGPAAFPCGDARVLPIETLALNPRLQVRTGLDAGAVRRYAEILKNGGDLPPITVASVNGALFVVDGWHRVKAMKVAGRTHADAIVVKATEREAVWLAATANLAHGVPLKKKELRNVFRAYVCSRQHVKRGGALKSYREISGDLNGLVSHNTVHNWMRKDFRKIAARMGGGQGAIGSTASSARRVFEPSTADALAALEGARAAYNGITDADERRRVLEAAEELVRGMGGATDDPLAECPF